MTHPSGSGEYVTLTKFGSGGPMRALLSVTIAATSCLLLAACESRIGAWEADEEHIVLYRTGWDYAHLDARAEAHCAQFDKTATRMAWGGYNVTYECRDKGSETYMSDKAPTPPQS